MRRGTIFLLTITKLIKNQFFFELNGNRKQICR